MYMISYDTCVPYKPHNISVVSRAPMEVHHASEHPLPPIVEAISPLDVPSVPPDIG